MAKPRKQYRPSGDVLMNPFALEDLIGSGPSDNIIIIIGIYRFFSR